MNWKNNYLATLILILLNVVIIGLFLGSIAIFEIFKEVKNIGWYLVCYLVICFISYQIYIRLKNKFTEIIYYIICFPFSLFYIYLKIAIPVLSLQIHLWLYIIIVCAIPLVLNSINSIYNFLPLTLQTSVYLILTFASISAIVLNTQIRNLAYRISPARPKTSEKMKKFNLIELNDYLLSESNLRFVVYFLYFLYLIILNFNSFQGLTFYKNEFIDKAVLQSFITFVAFDRVLTNFRQSEFRPNEFLKKLYYSILQKSEKEI